MQWFNQLRKSRQPVIVVSGLPRSGTSLMMQMLHSAQVPILTDHKRQPDHSNPKGYFEFEPVKQMATREIDWMGQAQGKAVKIVSPLLPHLPTDFRYQVIFMLRDIGEIVASQTQMMYPHKPSDNAQSEYQQHLDKIKQWLAIQPNIEVIYIHHRQAIEQPLSVAQDIGQFLGKSLDIEAMGAVIEPNLYRNRG
jgi:hypothetical protein